MATTYSNSDELEELLRQLSNNPTYNEIGRAHV